MGFEPTVPRCGTPVFETGPHEPQLEYIKDLRQPVVAVVPSVVPCVAGQPFAAFESPSDGHLLDPDLGKVVRAWGLLPGHIKLAILALAQVAKE